ncbi:MAG TPA: hypothetical protein VFD43_13575 [Planctomycetota bacterium]|nr:hypothetical protein [Planctomycetota bacterium]
MPEMHLTIHLVHGPAIRLKGQRSDRDLMNFGSNVERGMDSPFLAFQVDGQLTLVPRHNIASVELTPVPDGLLLKHLIKDVQRAD